MRCRSVLPFSFAWVALTAGPAVATFHFMQIEQVIGGVDGDTAAQAIQLRTRILNQNSLGAQARLNARDAAGLNPVLLIDFPSNVANTAAGTRILVATSDFSSHTTSGITPDFILTNPIPASYLAAGSLTFEGSGIVYWRLSWGGDDYTGSGAGSITNDADGNFSPPFSGPLPSGAGEGLLFQGPHTAPSTNNAADYALTAGAAVFFNSTGNSGTVVSLVDVPEGGSGELLSLGSPFPNPVRDRMSYSLTMPREADVRIDLLDLRGRRVATLVDERLPAGRHALAWDASGRAAAELPSGVYFLGLTAEGEQHVRSFVLLR